MPNDTFQSPYVPNTDQDRRRMLDAIGVDSVDDLFRDVPDGYLNYDLDIPSAKDELELGRYAAGLASMNMAPGDYACFLGAGSYRHHIPAVVRQITGRSEYMTAYTPYQPEVSQGTLANRVRVSVHDLPDHRHGRGEPGNVRRLYVPGRGGVDGRANHAQGTCLDSGHRIAALSRGVGHLRTGAWY